MIGNQELALCEMLNTAHVGRNIGKFQAGNENAFAHHAYPIRIKLIIIN